MDEKRTLLIAEAGVNHNCDTEIARRMIDCAKEAGADIVKFQTGLPKNVISRYAPKADYQKRNTNDFKESQLEMAKGSNIAVKPFVYRTDKTLLFEATQPTAETFFVARDV